MTPLTAGQRKYLRALAHALDPICYVGKKGITDTLIQSVETALGARELLKIKFNDCKEEKEDISNQIAEKTHSHRVGLIGNIAILYRQHPDEDKRVIVLPGSR